MELSVIAPSDIVSSNHYMLEVDYLASSGPDNNSE
jgi:hypothetical protein